MCEALAAAGIVSDTEAVQDERDVFLGFELEVQSTSWRPVPKRIANIFGALDYVLRLRAYVTGAEVECLLGHLMSAMLLRRELLSVSAQIWRSSGTPTTDEFPCGSLCAENCDMRELCYRWRQPRGAKGGPPMCGQNRLRCGAPAAAAGAGRRPWSSARTCPILGAIGVRRRGS